MLRVFIACCVLLLCEVLGFPASANPSSISYTGQLLSAGAPVANGSYDFQFSLYTAATGGSQVNSPISLSGIPVANGVFYVELNLGNTTTGAALYLQTAYRKSGTTTYTIQSPRKLIPTSSYADYAAYSGSASALQGFFVSATPPTNGQVLTWTAGGNKWLPQTPVVPPAYSAGVGLTLSGNQFSILSGGVTGSMLAVPLSLNDASNSTLLSVTNTGNGTGIVGFSSGGFGIQGSSVSNRGVSGSSGTNTGVVGVSDSGFGTQGSSNSSYGVYGSSNTSMAVAGVSTSGTGIYGASASGNAGQFDGPVVINGRATVHVLQIVGGSDVAEPYTVASVDGVTPRTGMVVSIDPARTGQMALSHEAYDRAVAGIISGAGGIQPGLTLRQQGGVADGALPIACTGRVWCWCDADAGGAIAPGDLLTTSGTPGYAMKASGDGRSRGAILGKAMSSLKSGKGLILVLVTLQ